MFEVNVAKFGMAGWIGARRKFPNCQVRVSASRSVIFQLRMQFAVRRKDAEHSVAGEQVDQGLP